MRYASCTIECVATQECARCGKRKAPMGRSVPMEAWSGYCHSDCHGYYQDPKPGHLWPEEWDDPEGGDDG